MKSFSLSTSERDGMYEITGGQQVAGSGKTDFALIARFVQQRQLVGCIACDKDMCNAGLHGEAVGFGHAALIKLDAQVFQAEFVHIGAAADGGEHHGFAEEVGGLVRGEDGSTADALAEVLDTGWQGAVPYTLLIAPGGTVVYRHHGPFDPLALRRAIVNVTCE